MPLGVRPLHQRLELGPRKQLEQLAERQGSPVAVETIGKGYWIVDEIVAAGC